MFNQFSSEMKKKWSEYTGPISSSVGLFWVIVPITWIYIHLLLPLIHKIISHRCAKLAWIVLDTIATQEEIVSSLDDNVDGTRVEQHKTITMMSSSSQSISSSSSWRRAGHSSVRRWRISHLGIYYQLCWIILLLRGTYHPPPRLEFIGNCKCTSSGGMVRYTHTHPTANG